MTFDRSAFARERVVLYGVFCSAAAASSPTLAGGDAAGTMLFTPEPYMAHVRYLASDALAGRDTGSPGNDEAAEYVARHFRELGLQPAGVDGAYFQPFEVRDGKKLVDAAAKLEIAGLAGDWQIRTDWITLPFSDLATVEGPLAFAGFGIHAPDSGYDDFADFDATGKILIIFRGEPKSDDPKAAIGGSEASSHALFRTKARVAAKQGAKALLIVNAKPKEDGKDELYPFDERLQLQTYEIPMLHLSRRMAEALVRHAGLPALDELQAELEPARKPRSRDLPGGLTARIAPGLETNILNTRNVLARLPGESAPNEYIVIGAHYDHVGTRPRQFQRRNTEPQIHNGADDNASGTAGLIELARVLSSGPRMRRSVLFIAFSGEERGLLGSKHFVKEPTVPLEQIKAMINFDMIGRLSMDRLTIYGTFSAREFDALVKAAAEEHGIKYKAARDVPGNSDHAPFHRKKIPVLFPFTAMHKQYHQPEDDWERIDAGGAARLLQMCHELIRDVADMTDGPTWLDGDAADDLDDASPGDPKAGTPDVSKFDANAAHAAAAAAVKAADEERANAKKDGDGKSDADNEAAAPRMPKVRLGIMPEYGDTGKAGLGVEGLVEGGAAEKAGFKDGDRIIRIADRTVKDIYGYMDAMAEIKPGDTVEFTLQRGAQTVTVKVTFDAEAARPRRDDG